MKYLGKLLVLLFLWAGSAFFLKAEKPVFETGNYEVIQRNGALSWERMKHYVYSKGLFKVDFLEDGEGFLVETYKKGEQLWIMVFDSKGVCCSQQFLFDKGEVDFSPLDSGIYYLSLSSNKVSNRQMFRVVKR